MEANEILLSRLKLKQLRLLVAVGENLSILRAARALRISQPAATKMINDLENDMGGPFFLRTNRGVLPNERGVSLIRHAQVVLAQIHSAIRELGSLTDGTSGTVAVGSLQTAATTLLPHAITELRRQRPRVSVMVTEGGSDQLFPALQKGDLEIVVGRLPNLGVYADLSCEFLYRENISIVVNGKHELLKRKKLRLGDLRNSDWILPPGYTTVRRHVEETFRDANLEPPRVAVQSISLSTSRRLLIDSDMVAVLPDLVIKDELQTGSLARLPIKLAAAAVGISRRREIPLSAGAEALVAAIWSAAKQITGGRRAPPK